MGGGVWRKWSNTHPVRTRLRRVCALWLLGGPLLITTPAQAGAWTRPAGEGLIISSASHHQFDLQAEGFGYSKLETAVYLEYGLTDRFTLLGRISQETRFHQSRVERRKGGSVILMSVHSVSTALGDSEMGVRTRLLERGGWTVSAQTSLVRFSVEPNPLLEPTAHWGADSRLLVGRSVGKRAFAEAQLAHRAHWAGQRDETRLDLTVGLRPSEGWMVMAQSYSAWGDTGWSAYTHSYESHRVHLSVIAPLGEGLSLQLGAIKSAYSDRLAPESAYMLSLWREF